MEEKYAAASIEVEKADTKRGILFLKVCAATPGVEDLDGDIPDEGSMEAAFYDFLENTPDEPFDLDHKTKLAGRIVAGWWFPDEHLGRVAFKPQDKNIVRLAEDGEITGTSYAASVTRTAITL